MNPVLLVAQDYLHRQYKGNSYKIKNKKNNTNTESKQPIN